jgi:hypothetical protein
MPNETGWPRLDPARVTRERLPKLLGAEAQGACGRIAQHTVEIGAVEHDGTQKRAAQDRARQIGAREIRAG